MLANNIDLEYVLLHIANPDGSITDFAVMKKWLELYLELLDSGEITVTKFLEEYTSEDSNDILTTGLLANAIAFIVDPSENNPDVPYNICGSNDPWKTKALIDYISQELQSNGFEEASKFLDCKFDL